MKLKDFLYFVYLMVFVACLYAFVTAVQVPIDPMTIPDYTDYRDSYLPTVREYPMTVAIVDINGIEHHYMKDENGEPIFDVVDMDYTNSIYRDYLSYKLR